jgi:ABC-2 type transport system ATP-binding protein
MSSHIMSDVERVCGRVAVIRQGELVTIEEVEKLRQKAGQRVTVEFGDAVSAEELARIPGVSMVTSINHAYHFTVGGSMDALIKALSHHEVLRLQAEEAPLEEVFLKFYENPQAETAAPGTR